MVLRSSVLLLLLLMIVSYSPIYVYAQGELNETEDVAEIDIPEKGSRIWSGSARIFRQTFYNYRVNQDESHDLLSRAQTTIDLQFRHLWFLNRSLSIGLDAFGQFYMEDTFGNLALGGGGLGPLVRYYPFMKTLNPQWQPYLQGSVLAGYDLALGDSVGAIRGEGFRIRSGLFGGLTYRMSNALGIYLEAGRAWESEGFSSPDARAWQLTFGFQVFRF